MFDSGGVLYNLKLGPLQATVHSYVHARVHSFAITADGSAMVSVGRTSASVS